MFHWALSTSSLYIICKIFFQCQPEVAKNITQSAQPEDISSRDFVFLQLATPILFLTYVLYPRSCKEIALSEYLGLAMELVNIFDIMNIIPDIKYISNYGTAWVVVFDASVGIALLSIIFPLEISTDDLAWSKITVTDLRDQRDNKPTKSNLALKDKNRKINCSAAVDDDREMEKYHIEKNENSPLLINKSVDKAEGSVFVRSHERYQEFVKFNENDTLSKIVKVTVMMFFIDIMFATTRFKIMITEQSVQLGFTMIVKNFILTFLHLSYLLRMLKIYIVNRKHRLNCICKKDDSVICCSSIARVAAFT